MGRTGELIAETQSRLDDIETEATRLIVFAETTSDIALGTNLKKIAEIVFRNATEIEERMKELTSIVGAAEQKDR
jgi:hypothetical protein